MLLGCCLALFIGSLDVTIVNVALPAIQADLRASVSGLQWIASAYTVVLASLLLLAGSTGDRIGRRAIFQAGLAVFAAASLACSAAPNLGVLIVFRMLQAAGAAMMQPNALSTITNVITDPVRRAHAIGVWAAVFGVAVASGPVIGGLLVAAIGWRAVFWVNLPVAAIAFALVTRNAPETRAPRPRRADPPGQALLIATLATVTYATIEGPALGWASASITGCYAVAGLSLAAFVTVERRRAEPLLELRFFRSPAFSGATASATLAFAILAGFLFLNTLYLQEVRGYSPVMAGVAVLPATAVMAVVSPLAARLVARGGSRLPMTAAGLFLAAGTFILRDAASYPLLASGYVLVGLGFGLINPPITNAAVSGMPREQAGVASAVATSSRQLGSALGIAIIGSVVAAGVGRAGTGRGGSGHTSQAFRVAFTTASHAGWDIAIACGLAVAVLGYLTTGATSRSRAEPRLPQSPLTRDAPARGARRSERLPFGKRQDLLDPGMALGGPAAHRTAIRPEDLRPGKPVGAIEGDGDPTG